MSSRSIETPHYHVWTDALRGRDLAMRTKDDWDRGMFVRMSVISAWTAFERAVEGALNAQPFRRDFWRSFEDACRACNIDPPTRGGGPWQRVAGVHGLRRQYAHLLVVDQSDLLPDTAEPAQNAIIVLREALKDLHGLRTLDPPEWIDEDRLPEHPTGASGDLTVGHGGADPESPETIRVSYQYRERETVSDILPAGTDHVPYMEAIIRNIVVPISAVRAYRGKTLIDEIVIRMRGVNRQR